MIGSCASCLGKERTVPATLKTEHGSGRSSACRQCGYGRFRNLIERVGLFGDLASGANSLRLQLWPPENNSLQTLGMHVAVKEKYVKRKQLISFLSLVILMALSPAALTASTWYVDGANGNDNNNCLSASTACKTIGHAISLAGSGDSILVTAGLYQEHLTIAVNVSLIGSGQGTIIDGQSTDRVVNISVATVVVTLSNLTIRNGMGNSGAGVLNYGTLTLNNTTITGNHA